MNVDAPDTAVAAATERVLALLPVHARARDEQTGGLLRAVVQAVAAELAVLEADVDELYASWFVETCPEWVVPYLADLLGVVDLPPEVGGGAGVSRRAFVANTVAYRRRKGTAAVVEQVARDATGWPARVVEHHRLLAVAAHVNHVRTDRPATASVRTSATSGGPLELVPRTSAQGALDPLAHTADVRRIGSGRGRYGIGHLGVYLFPDQVHPTGWAPARPPDAGADDGWAVHPLGLVTPLYAAPAAPDPIERLADESDLPVPLRPRRLLALLTAARTDAAATASGSDAARAARDALPVGARVAGADLDPERLRVRGLEDLAADPGSDPAAPAPLPGWQLVVDAVRGRVHPYRDGVAAAPADLLVRHAYGATADVGAGSHDRTGVHLDVLAADPYRGDPARGGPDVTAQVAVIAGSTDPAVPATIRQALEVATTAWGGGVDPAPAPAGGTFVVAVGDDATYGGDLTVHVPSATRLVLVAAAWRPRVLGAEVLEPVPGVYAPRGLRPHVRGTLTVSGDGGSSVVLDGLVVEGDVVVADGALGSLAISQCTVAGRVLVGRPAAASNPGVVVRLVRSITGPVAFGPGTADLLVEDGVVDAALRGPGSGGGPAVVGDGVALEVAASTIRGGVAVRTLEASSAVLDGHVEIEHRQTGCVRYSFVTPGSRVPRRFRCMPDPAGPRGLRPVYASTDLGSPHYLALARTCPAEIAVGGEDGSEPGVHHHLRRPARLASVARLVAPYVPVGLEIGVAAPVATGRS